MHAPFCTPTAFDTFPTGWSFHSWGPIVVSESDGLLLQCHKPYREQLTTNNFEDCLALAEAYVGLSSCPRLFA